MCIRDSFFFTLIASSPRNIGASPCRTRKHHMRHNFPTEPIAELLTVWYRPGRMPVTAAIATNIYFRGTRIHCAPRVIETKNAVPVRAACDRDKECGSGAGRHRTRIPFWRMVPPAPLVAAGERPGCMVGTVYRYLRPFDRRWSHTLLAPRPL